LKNGLRKRIPQRIEKRITKTDAAADTDSGLKKMDWQNGCKPRIDV
jgi:hypothetical protein